MHKNSGNGLPVVLSYALLGGTSIYCFTKIKDHSFFPPHVTYIVMSVNGVLGFIASLGTDTGRLGGLPEMTALVQGLFALPCINTPIWLSYGYQEGLCWAWCLVPIIPLVFHLANEKGLPENFVEIMIDVNIIGLGVLCLTKENWEGVGAACAYAVAHCLAGDVVVNNCALAAFAYLALMAMGYERR